MLNRFNNDDQMNIPISVKLILDLYVVQTLVKSSLLQEQQRKTARRQQYRKVQM